MVSLHQAQEEAQLWGQGQVMLHPKALIDRCNWVPYSNSWQPQDKQYLLDSNKVIVVQVNIMLHSNIANKKSQTVVTQKF